MTTADAGQLGKDDIKTRRGSRRLRHRRSRRLDRAQGRRDATRHAGFLDGIELSREEAEAIIMAARVKAGWIEPEARKIEESEAAEARRRPSGQQLERAGDGRRPLRHE